MSHARSIDLGDDERDDLLGNGGIGVISFVTAGEAPYSLPVSYGYDAQEGNFYFRLAFDPDSEKWATRLEQPVSFVVYNDEDGMWRSVVATGTLSETNDEALDMEVLEGMRRVHIPLYDVFEEDTRETTFRFFHLDPDSLTARTEVPITE